MAFLGSLSVPYAILPSSQETDDVVIDDNTTSVDRSIFSLSENECHEWENMFQGHAGAWCVGSSRDWLILLNSNGFPLLQNPSSAISIPLPPFPDTYVCQGNVTYSYYVKYLRKSFVFKAVLMYSPSPYYIVAMMYGYPCKLAYCKPSTWAELPNANRYYCDIVFENNILYALAEDGTLEGWNFHQRRNPKKILDITPTADINEEEERDFPIGKFSKQLYLVISKGEFLSVKRFIGDFVNEEGEVVYEGWSDDHDGSICPYRTKHFFVYKLDFLRNKWVKKRFLEDQALFLGANESRSVTAQTFSGCKENSIYFTDDRWEEMSLDYSYGGHDWGVFSLQDKRVKLLAPYTNKMDPPPIWVVPSSNLQAIEYRSSLLTPD
ncbi:hypothetical protein SESBI_40489 [Sesbania bispinosa]|nr:hypothetical protein SESBI_50205 [Sesbania bispinosa]KAJ1386798.1 hypothetical protein SESBI_40489 [Sesbania bispinosa]